jgi:hypothetical protein
MFNNNLFNSAQDNHNDSSKIAKNPFKQEEVLQAWLESDLDYNKAKLRARKILQPNKPQFFMSFKDSYLSFVHLITKNAIVATLLMLVSAGAVSASALQAFGPDEYKPSTIIQKTFNPKDFAVNTVKEKNPYTPLNWDENNNVAFLSECDLAIKYPSKYSDGEPSSFYRVSNTSDNAETIYISSTDQAKQDSYTGVSITCLKDTNLLSGLKSDIIENGKPARSVYGIELKVNGNQFIKDNLGWFITQSELKNVRIYQSTFNNEEYTIYFEYNNLYYLVGYQTSNYTFNKLETSRKVNVVKGSDIQVQFISLVTSQANKVVMDGSGKVIDDKTIADSTLAITVEPKNASLEKNTNTIPYVTDGYGVNSVCGIFGVTSYKFPGDALGGYMQVTSSKLNLDKEQKESFNLFNDYINEKTVTSTSNSDPLNIITSQFANSCSGGPGYQKLVDATQINYSGTDKAKIVYATASQDVLGNPTVLILAYKGDNQILLTDYISEIRYPIIPIAEACGMTRDVDFNLIAEKFDPVCYQNKMKNDPKLKEIMDQSTKDLLKTFELK